MVRKKSEKEARKRGQKKIRERPEKNPEKVQKEARKGRVSLLNYKKKHAFKLSLLSSLIINNNWK